MALQPRRRGGATLQYPTLRDNQNCTFLREKGAAKAVNPLLQAEVVAGVIAGVVAGKP